MAGIGEVADQIRLVSFVDYDPGFCDDETGRPDSAREPFVPEKASTMSPE